MTEYTTHTRVTVSIPHEDAAKLVRAGVGQTDSRIWAGPTTTADLAAALGLVTRGTHREQVAAAQRERDEASNELVALRAELDQANATLARVRALAETWRYKGEFGWGPWQAGEGPDPEGAALDDASAQLRAALTPTPPQTGPRTETRPWSGVRTMTKAETLAGLTEAIAGQHTLALACLTGDDLDHLYCVCEDGSGNGEFETVEAFSAHVAAVALAWLEGHGWAEGADAWDEGFRAGYADGTDTGPTGPDNPYKEAP